MAFNKIGYINVWNQLAETGADYNILCDGLTKEQLTNGNAPVMTGSIQIGLKWNAPDTRKYSISLFAPTEANKAANEKLPAYSGVVSQPTDEKDENGKTVYKNIGFIDVRVSQYGMFGNVKLHFGNKEGDEFAISERFKFSLFDNTASEYYQAKVADGKRPSQFGGGLAIDDWKPEAKEDKPAAPAKAVAAEVVDSADVPF